VNDFLFVNGGFVAFRENCGPLSRGWQINVPTQREQVFRILVFCRIFCRITVLSREEKFFLIFGSKSSVNFYWKNCNTKRKR